MIFDFKKNSYGRIISSISSYLIKKVFLKKKINLKLKNLKKINFKKNIVKHTGYPGGLRVKNFFSNKKNVFNSIRGMLPKNKIYKKFFIYLK
ncbi:hypothetical protein ACT2CI_00100 [Candidatus Vidania fulgoroideorum]